ncbi:MAG: septum formation initiator family protein [Patescibacteria group bacterium]
MVSKKVFAFILLAVTPILLLSFISAWVKHQELARRYQGLEAENLSLETENQELGALLEHISLDAVKELEVRKKLNYTKPGEKLVIFVSPSPIPEPTPARQSFFDKILKVFSRQ